MLFPYKFCYACLETGIMQGQLRTIQLEANTLLTCAGCGANGRIGQGVGPRARSISIYGHIANDTVGDDSAIGAEVEGFFTFYGLEGATAIARIL